MALSKMKNIIITDLRNTFMGQEMSLGLTTTVQEFGLGTGGVVQAGQNGRKYRVLLMQMWELQAFNT